jgi:purine-nucleoside phosphorylase
MESAAIYTIAARYGARALTSLTVSDHIKRGDKMDSAQREQGFSDMVQIGLDTAIA